MILFPFTICVLQVLRYFDYVFTGVFTFEMVIKVKTSIEKLGSPGFGWDLGLPLQYGVLPQCCHLPANDRHR